MQEDTVDDLISSFDIESDLECLEGIAYGNDDRSKEMNYCNWSEEKINIPSKTMEGEIK